MFIIQKFEKNRNVTLVTKFHFCIWNTKISPFFQYKLNKIIKFVLSVKLWEEIGFLQDLQKVYIFYAICFLYVFQKKAWNKLWMGTHAN